MSMRIALVVAVLTLASRYASADDWGQFRGVNASGLSAEKSVPEEWSKDKNVLWKVKAPGRGWSSPVVAGNKIFLTSASSPDDRNSRPGGGGRPGGGFPGGGGPGGGGFGRGNRPPDTVYKLEVVCLDRDTGKVIWQKTAREDKPKIPTHGQNTFASETPVIDGDCIYAYFGMHGIYCYDLDGKELWKKDLGSFQMQMNWGTSSSPIAADGKVFVQVDNEEKSFIIALDGKNGEQVWKINRTERTNWGSPIIWKNSKRTELIAPGSQKVISYSLADGKVLWELNMGGGRCCATPTGDNEHLYVGIGAGGGGGGMGGGRPGAGAGGRPGGGGMGGGASGKLFAVKAGASGDVTPKRGETSSENVAWVASRAGPAMSSPLAYQGYIYLLEQRNGMVTCLDAKTGKTSYERERIAGAREFWASPWAHDGKIYCLDGSGTTHILKAGPKFEVLGKNSLEDQTWATPAISGGMLFVRGVSNVYAIKK